MNNNIVIIVIKRKKEKNGARGSKKKNLARAWPRANGRRCPAVPRPPRDTRGARARSVAREHALLAAHIRVQTSRGRAHSVDVAAPDSRFTHSPASPPRRKYLHRSRLLHAYLVTIRRHRLGPFAFSVFTVPVRTRDDPQPIVIVLPSAVAVRTHRRERRFRSVESSST